MQTNQATEQHRKPTALEQAGGTKGLVYSALPVMAFVVANSIEGLTAAIVVAGAVALAITAHRLLRKESVQPAIGGLVGVVIAAGITWYTGSAKDYFLLGIWGSLAGSVLFVLSVLVKWPLAGVIWNTATGKGTVWRADRNSRFYFNLATLTLAVIFGARFVVQRHLYESDEVGSLGVAKIAMGYPLLALGLLVLAWAARASDRRLRAVGLLLARND
ncbi:DUF3159 domain-containing protein [Streptomyces scopuliridis]|uniref:DUF3159 domain-containing protein n=1 Tax=Streptomyces scopuliridis TaxID=452529 RepID=UPI0036A2D32F